MPTNPQVQITDTALFGQAPPPPRRFYGITNRSFYLPMRDGVRLAVDLYLPKDLPAGEKLPALLVQSRYWRRTGRGFRRLLPGHDG
jgi:predicted acyl esterase